MELHNQRDVKFSVDEELAIITQIIVDYYGSIISIASCQDDEKSGEAYLFVTTLSLIELNRLICNMGVEIKVEKLLSDDFDLPIPRWSLRWNKKLTKQIEENLGYKKKH